MRSSGERNPFEPGAGRMPRFLAGRETEVARFEDRLARLAEGVAPPQGFLLQGPRGNGKTVLLDRLAELARSRGFLVEELDADVLSDRDALMAALRQRVSRSTTRVTGVQVGPVGVSVEGPQETSDLAHLFSTWLSGSPAPLVVLIDEAQRTRSGAGQAFFSAVQRAGRARLPFLLVLAGTPGTSRRLRRAGTFTERMFERLRIGRLRPDATSDALRIPAEEAGRPMESEALSLLGVASQRYPYFIQLLGSAAWEACAASDEPRITPRAARAGIENARGAVADFYAERFAEARDLRVEQALLPLANLFHDRSEPVLDHDLDAVLDPLCADGRVEQEPRALAELLQDLGVLWESSPGVWEMGIPSFGTHVRERAGR